MTPISRIACNLAFVAACGIFCVAPYSVAHSHQASLGEVSKNAFLLIQQMVGTWDVQQRMWAGPDTEAIDLPRTVAHRRLVEGAFLEEVMTPVPESKQEPFTRIAYFNYNTVSQQYEYFSMDTRAPQMMTYVSSPGRL